MSDDVDERLKRLALRTRALEPGPGLTDAVLDAARDSDSDSLGALASRSDGIEIDGAFSDAVLDAVDAELDAVDDRLGQLGSRTADLRPAEPLTDRVLDRLEAPVPEPLGAELWRTGRVALFGFAAAAAACAVWATQAGIAVDEEAIATVEVLELDQ